MPDGFIDIKRMFLRRVVFIVRKFNIPPALFINLDETGVCLLPSQKRTWGPSEVKQISVLGWGDKRQFTVIPAISAEGKLVGKAQVIRNTCTFAYDGVFTITMLPWAYRNTATNGNQMITNYESVP